MPAAKREPRDGRPQSAWAGAPWAGALVLALTSLRCRIDTERWRRGSLTLPHPVWATQHLPYILGVGVGPAYANRRQEP